MSLLGKLLLYRGRGEGNAEEREKLSYRKEIALLPLWEYTQTM
jgi:hypothetical protein